MWYENLSWPIVLRAKVMDFNILSLILSSTMNTDLIFTVMVVVFY